jgi:hypothetical protein
LERASVLSGTETRSVGSVTETEEGVQVTQPQDDQPLRRFVVRASSFSKEDFDALLQHQGLYNGGRAAGWAPNQLCRTAHTAPRGWRQVRRRL